MSPESEPIPLQSLGERPETVGFDKLSFAELSQTLHEVQELAAKTFTQTENGFRNTNGDGIAIGNDNGIFKVVSFSPALKDFNSWAARTSSEESIVKKGSPDREAMMTALRQLLLELGNRVIE